jgi:phosphoribosylglycinamide formyltransferase 1
VSRVAVFASGRGSNLSALLAAQERFSSYRVVLVATNVQGCGAAILSEQAGIETRFLPSRGVSRKEHDQALVAAVLSRAIDVVCLAGYMRILGPAFIEAFPGPVMNVHPSLLPAFPGMHAQKQAIDAGVRWSGATVHFVDQGLDTGPIILQEPVRVFAEDTEQSLSLRILEKEHQIYPDALDLVARKKFEVRGRKVFLSTDPRQ